MNPAARRKVLSLLGSVLGLGMLALAVWIFDRTLARYELAEVVRRLEDIPESRLALALLCVVLSYFTQTLYDFLALASLGRGASLPRTGLAAFIANALVNNMGFSLLTATSLRYRFYSAWGYTPLEIAQVVAMTKLSFFSGLLTLSGLALSLAPVDLPGRIGGILNPRLIGIAMLVLPALLLLWNGRSKSGYLHLGRYTLVRPGQRILALQIAVSALHLVFSGLALYFLLPAEALAGAGLGNPLPFLAIFMILKFVVLFFPIPGGLGVLEGTAVALLTPALPDYPLLGGLLAYRILYYLLPFALGLASLAIYELGFRSGLASGIASRGRSSAAALRRAGARLRQDR
jgi:uncharacterized membrane protein YbhN (UPF0104 family)